MKDRPLLGTASSSSIPVISPLLHCLAMPVLVFLRYSLGYSYLSPKKVFLSSIFVAALFAYVVWHDPAFSQFFTLAAFAVLASALYLIHLVYGILRLTQSIAEHDYYSGTSFLLVLIPPAKREKYEGFTHCIAEPFLMIGIGYFVASGVLGKVLVVSGIAIGLKELIRTWLLLRSQKVLADNLEDAEDKMKKLRPSTDQQPLPTKGRTQRERYKPDSEEG